MIKKYKSISTVKAKNPEGKKPTHYLVAKENKDSEQGDIVANLWAKSGEKDGKKYNFLSGKMSDFYQGQDKAFDGFCIVNERELDDLIAKLSAKQNSPLGNDYPVEGLDADIPNPEDIPF